MSKKILLVEDEAVIAMNEARMLKKHGYVVVSANNGEKAVELVDSDPDIFLVLMDIDLGSGMDGTEAAEQILEKHDLPIVFLTSHAEKEYVDKVKTITGSGYILKNSGEFVLIESIHMAFNLFEAKREAQYHLQETALRESRLKHLNRLLLSIRNVNQIITKETDIVELLDKTCSLLIEKSGYERAWIVLLRHGKPEEPYFHAGFSGTFGQMTDFLNSGQIPICAEAALQSNAIQALVQNIANCGNCPFRRRETAKACAEAKKTVLTAKLEHAGKLQGWISVLVPKMYADNRDDQRLFEEIAGDISYALQSIAANKETIETKELLENTMNAIPDAIGVLDSNFNVINYNSAGCQLLGKTPEKVEGKKCYELINRSVPCEICSVKKSYATKNIEQFERYEASLDMWIDLRAYPILDAHGDVIKIIEHFQDITERKLAEESLKSKENNLRITLNSIGDAVISTDLDGNINRMNPVAEQLTGWSVDEAEGKALTEVFHIINAYTRQPADNPVEKVLQTGEIAGLANHTVLISKDGNEYQIADSAAPIMDDAGNSNGVVLVFRDVTEKYEQEYRLRRTQEIAHIGNWELDIATQKLYWSDEIYRIFGLQPQEFETTYEAFLKRVHPEDRDKVDSAYWGSIKEGKDKYEVEHRVIRADNGEVRHVHEKCEHKRDHKNEIISSIGMVQDITERKMAEEELVTSKKFFTTIVDNIPTMVFMKETDNFTFFLVNRAAEETIGMKREDLIGKSDYDVFPKHEADFFRKKDLEVINGGKEVVIQEEELTTSEKVRYLFTKKVPIFNEKGKPRYLLGISEDITELKNALEEKDFLMKELNHRVKNNLAMISSLINLKDPEFKSDLSNIRDQIGAISLIHEKLYQTGNVTEIGCRDYFDDLLNSIFSSFTTWKVEIEANIDDVYVPTKTAVPLGLVVNEIATNAIKHGFNEKGPAVFSIKMEKDKENNRCKLTLSNTGKPFPEELDIENTDTLGLRLISALVAQIGGTIELRRFPYPVFTIRFPIEAISKDYGK